MQHPLQTRTRDVGGGYAEGHARQLAVELGQHLQAGEGEQSQSRRVLLPVETQLRDGTCHNA